MTQHNLTSTDSASGAAQLGTSSAWPANVPPPASVSDAPDEHQRAWAYLSRVVEGPNQQLQDFLAAGKTPEELAAAIKRREDWLGGLLKSTQSRHDWDMAETDLRTIAELGGRLITVESPEWPGVELNQAFSYAASGNSPHIRSYASDAVPPHALWILGKPLQPLCERAVALVGTRGVTRYGYDVIHQLVTGLAQHQWTIVSGGAVGVDAGVHQKAIQSGTATVCVQAAGLAAPYPRRNNELFREIVKNGALVSEYPPDAVPARHRFLTRNRLVAALSLGTVVVEAAWRSGALNTLSWAEGLGRVPMAVPGPIMRTNSVGCHERIKNGSAQLVTSADDIRQLLQPLTMPVAGEQEELSFEEGPPQLSRTELRVFDAIPAPTNYPTAGEISGQGIDTESLAREAGVPLPLAMHVLVMLQKRGIVAREGVTWRRLT